MLTGAKRHSCSQRRGFRKVIWSSCWWGWWWISGMTSVGWRLTLLHSFLQSFRHIDYCWCGICTEQNAKENLHHIAQQGNRPRNCMYTVNVTWINLLQGYTIWTRDLWLDFSTCKLQRAIFFIPSVWWEPPLGVFQSDNCQTALHGNENLAVANRSRTQYVEGIYDNPRDLEI